MLFYLSQLCEVSVHRREKPSSATRIPDDARRRIGDPPIEYFLDIELAVFFADTTGCSEQKFVSHMISTEFTKTPQRAGRVPRAHTKKRRSHGTILETSPRMLGI